MEAAIIGWGLLLSGLILNSVLSVFSPAADHPATTTTTESVQCCACRPPPQTLDRQLNYSKLAQLKPTLNAEYRTTTLTRLGTDLHFDVSQCPTNSLMRGLSPTFSPAHLNCPTLFIVGARKGGTSSLYHYLSKHPDFEGTKLDRGPKVGETFYFSAQFDKVTWDEYIKSFPSDGVMTGESSVGNLVSCKAPLRLFQSCGKQAKIVMLLRNPVERFESNFLMRTRLSNVRYTNTTAISTVLTRDLDEFFNEMLTRQVDITKLPAQWDSIKCAFPPAQNMVYEGLYYVHLMTWLCNFPAENILIVNSEEFFKKRSVILDQVFQFLGLQRLDEDTYSWITEGVYNQGHGLVSQFQKLSKLERRKLRGVYDPLNKALFSVLDWKNVQW